LGQAHQAITAGIWETAIEAEPARYQSEVSRTIAFCVDHLTASARVHEMQLELIKQKTKRDEQ
jgi:hypothetical protein